MSIDAFYIYGGDSVKKKNILVLIVTGIVGISLVYPTSAQAFWPFDAWNKDNSQSVETGSKLPTLLDRIIERFGLNRDEVEEVVDEFHGERQAQMQKGMEHRLDTLVTDEKITEEQKEAIIAKQEEMRTLMDEWKDLDPEERKIKMQEKQEEMKAWSEEQGLDLRYVGLFGRGFHKGFRMGGKMH